MHVIRVCAIAGLFVLAGCATPRGGGGSVREEAALRCQPISEPEVAALFERWNDSLQTGVAARVVAHYAQRSILLPTLSNRPRLTPAEKQDYFEHFLQQRPSGRIDLRFVERGCNVVVDAGLYTFRFDATGAEVQARYSFSYRWDGARWLITTHHSSALPEPP